VAFVYSLYFTAAKGYTDDDYILLDCPGQSEINSNLTVFNTLINYLQNDGWTVRDWLYNGW